MKSSAIRWAVAGLALAAGTLGPSRLAAQSGLEAFVDSIAHEHVDSGRLAGISVGVVQGSDTLLLKGYGFADLEWDVPMPPDAIHEIGSVTKQFTSAAVLQLWSDGKLDLDADFTEYLPDYDTQGRTIPVRRLLDHTSGIKGYTEIAEFGRLMPQALPKDSLVAMFEAVPLEFEPGTAVIYNNSAYFLLGLIIEEVTGQDYADYLEEHVFPRADMDDTSYCTNDGVWKRRARGYAPSEDGLDRAAYLDHRWPYAAGSLCSTVGDLISWNRALHGGEVLGPDAYQMLITPAPLEDGTPIRYAMGITQYQAPSGRVIEHGGGIPGFLSSSRYYPDEDAIVVVLLNTAGPPGPDHIVDAIGERLFGDDHLPQARAYEGDLQPFVGRYKGPARGASLTLTVTVEDETLMVAEPGGEPEALDYLEGTTFFDGINQVIFEMDGDLAHTARLDQIGGHYVLTRAAAEAAATGVEVPLELLESYVGTYQLTPEFRIEVTVAEGQLHVQATGQPRFPLVADSDTEFHLEVVDASVEFVRGEGGGVNALILHQGGASQRAERVVAVPR